MSEQFPEFVCPYARRLAARSRPFALQAYDSKRKLSSGEAADKGFSTDPFGELSSAAKCRGIRQRFPDRVLVMTSNRCFMNCRHCTRRGILSRSEVVESEEDLRRAVDYVKARPRVRDVLLSGGDILTLSDDQVMRFVDAFAALGQIDIVRVCTRAPCVNPARITPALAQALGRSKKVWVNTQFNCVDEVTDEAKRAAALLVEAGVPVSCQTVLLKGVNDSAAAMLRLFRALSAARIRPYYVFMCDPVAGIDHFRVSLAKARAIEEKCARSIGGLSLPRFVCDLPGAKRKLPLSEVEP